MSERLHQQSDFGSDMSASTLMEFMDNGGNILMAADVKPGMLWSGLHTLPWWPSKPTRAGGWHRAGGPGTREARRLPDG
jgi:hypothetical protein